MDYPGRPDFNGVSKQASAQTNLPPYMSRQVSRHNTNPPAYASYTNTPLSAVRQPGPSGNPRRDASSRSGPGTEGQLPSQDFPRGADVTRHMQDPFQSSRSAGPQPGMDPYSSLGGPPMGLSRSGPAGAQGAYPAGPMGGPRSSGNNMLGPGAMPQQHQSAYAGAKPAIQSSYQRPGQSNVVNRAGGFINNSLENFATYPYKAATFMTCILLTMWFIGSIGSCILYNQQFHNLPYEDISTSTADGAEIILTTDRGKQSYLVAVSMFAGAFVFKLGLLIKLVCAMGSHRNWKMWKWAHDKRAKYLEERKKRHEMKKEEAKNVQAWHQVEATRGMGNGAHGSYGMVAI